MEGLRARLADRSHGGPSGPVRHMHAAPIDFGTIYVPESDWIGSQGLVLALLWLTVHLQASHLTPGCDTSHWTTHYTKKGLTEVNGATCGALVLSKCVTIWPSLKFPVLVEITDSFPRLWGLISLCLQNTSYCWWKGITIIMMMMRSVHGKVLSLSRFCFIYSV